MNQSPRGKRTRHFTAKAAARCVAYARRDGANDAELAKYIIEAYGLTNMPCLISQAVLVLSNVVFVGAILGALAGMLTLLKGIKIVVEGKISSVTVIPIEHFIIRYFPELQEHYGALLAWSGGGITILSTLIALIDSMVDQLVYYKFLDDVCKKKVRANPFPISPPPPNFDVFQGGDQSDKAQIERWIELTDTLFPN